MTNDTPDLTYQHLLVDIDGPVATLTLNRPEQLNTIVPPMPDEVETAVTEAIRDSQVKVIVLRGAGRAFCAGYDFGGGFHAWDELLTTDGAWDPGKDFVGVTGPLPRIVELGKPLGIDIMKGKKLASGGYEVEHTTNVIAVRAAQGDLVWTAATSPSQIADDLKKILKADA